MQLNLLVWAQAKRTLGFQKAIVEYSSTETPRDILRRYAQGSEIIITCRVALDEEIVSWDCPLGKTREMAILPPVSGG